MKSLIGQLSWGSTTPYSELQRVLSFASCPPPICRMSSSVSSSWRRIRRAQSMKDCLPDKGNSGHIIGNSTRMSKRSLWMTSKKKSRWVSGISVVTRTLFPMTMPKSALKSLFYATCSPSGVQRDGTCKMEQESSVMNSSMQRPMVAALFIAAGTKWKSTAPVTPWTGGGAAWRCVLMACCGPCSCRRERGARSFSGSRSQQ